MLHIGLRILLYILILLIGLGIGLFFRRLLVRRLNKTVLDNWIIQTLGILVILPTLLIALVLLPLIISWSPGYFASLWEKYTPNLPAKEVTPVVLGLLGNIFLTLLIIGLGVGLGRTLMRLVTGRLTEQHLDVNLRTLLGRVLYGIIIMIILFWILSLWQVSFTVPVVLISALTAAFAFSIQDVLKDLVAGVYILWERPFHIGDQITTDTYTGKVENVQLRSTRLRLVSGEEVSVPNMLIFGGVVINNSQYDERRAAITLTILQDNFAKDETPEQILKAVKEMENVLVKPEPTIVINHFAGIQGSAEASAPATPAPTVTLTLRFWIPSGRHKTINEVMCALHSALPDVDLTVENSAGDE